MRHKTGPPVIGEAFFDREDELARLRSAVDAGNHVLLTAPRRVGKSSLVLRLCAVLQDEGRVVVHLDVQHCVSEEEFIRTMLEGMRKAGFQLPPWLRAAEAYRSLRELFKGSKGKAGSVEFQIGAEESAVWRKLADAVGSVLDSAGGGVLIAVDELPIFLGKLADQEDGNQRAGRVLSWLRKVRQSATERVAWVMTGSVGLDSFVECRKLQGTINDLTPQTLGAYSDATAHAFLRHLAEGHQPPFALPDEVCTAIIRKAGWPLPYYLQLLFGSLVELPGARERGFPTTADVAAAYQELLEPHHRMQFGHWDSRLDSQFDDPADAGIARYILAHVCKQPRGLSREKLFQLLIARQPNTDPDALERRLRDILRLLEGDGYLLQHGESYAFRSFLLRDYWKRWCV